MGNGWYLRVILTVIALLLLINSFIAARNPHNPEQKARYQVFFHPKDVNVWAVIDGEKGRIWYWDPTIGSWFYYDLEQYARLQAYTDKQLASIVKEAIKKAQEGEKKGDKEKGD